MNVGIVVAREADEPTLTGFLGRLESLNCAAWSKDFLNFFQFIYSVNLPKIDVVSLQPLERKVQFLFRLFPRPFHRLRRHEDVLSKWWQDFTIDLLRAPIPVAMGIVQAVDAKIIGFSHNGSRLFSRNQWKSATGLSNDRKTLPGFAKDSSRNVTRL